jgi:hypothetical protein
MPRPWVTTIVNNPAEVAQFANTKEDYEVLKGLWIGLYAWQEFHDSHIVKRAKVIDTL